MVDLSCTRWHTTMSATERQPRRRRRTCHLESTSCPLAHLIAPPRVSGCAALLPASVGGVHREAQAASLKGAGLQEGCWLRLCILRGWTALWQAAM